jgi:hypothetical protein
VTHVEKKPESITEYVNWLSEAHNVIVDERYETYYNSVVSKVKGDLEKSTFWNELIENLEAYDQEYYLKNGFNLFNGNYKPSLSTKSFNSFILKTFRKNILENPQFPNAPIGGWILPNNWFSQIHDLIRTLFVVKYLDGVSYLKDQIAALCDKRDVYNESSFEAREEGYYAAHFLTRMPFEIPKINWDTEKVEFTIEIQITTQLQEVMRLLLHKYYDSARKKPVKPIEKWQWDYKSDEFCTNYLGHILHYVEGMIMEIREKQRSEKIC